MTKAIVIWIFTLAALAVLVCVGVSHAAKPEGAPASSPAETSWFAGASSPGGGPCCSEADGFREGIFYPYQDGTSGHYHPEGFILKEWRKSADKDDPDGYDVNILGEWKHVPKQMVVQGANPTGGAVAWVIFNYTLTPAQSTIFVRCFAPGNMF